jgi:PAS domain S-box-containing protein
MILNILLFINLLMLVVVVGAYVYNLNRERKYLKAQANQSLILQQRVYQAEVLHEINERIGYSLDTTKIVEIITSSLGNLLEHDIVSFMSISKDGTVVFKCHVQNSVSRRFVDQVKEKMLLSYSTILEKALTDAKIDESVSGNILDNRSTANLESYFNLPMIISGKMVGLVNVASGQKGEFGLEQASILYTITKQASDAVSKLEELLESEKGKLSAVIFSLTNGVIMVNSENQIMVYNPAISNILGLQAGKEVVMYDIVDALAGKLDLRTKIEQAQAENKTVNLPEVYVKDKALEISISPVKDKNGRMLGTSVVFHDITTQKSLEKLRQEFTAMMVHELRAPLTAVRWSSESLLKNLAAAQPGTEQGKVKDTMVTIETASNNMLELVNDLLDVAKIESGKFDLNPQEYDIVEVIKEQVKTFKSQAETKHLALNFNAPEKYKIKFDRVRISQVFGNLISNSIKYTDAGQIDVGVTINSADKQVVISVKDTGIGVAREDLNQLFSKFKQLRGSEHARKGTGLGLVVTKGIIEAHGGKIWAESPGENLGSTFFFSLPIA